MKSLKLTLLLLIVILASCAESDDPLPETTLDCIETYSVENGYDFEPIRPGVEPEGLTPEEAQARCEAKDYENCDASEFITPAAAKCIVQAEGLDCSDRSLQAHLELRSYSVVWFVDCWFTPVEGSRGAGMSLWIQASSGRILGRHEFQYISRLRHKDR